MKTPRTYQELLAIKRVAAEIENERFEAREAEAKRIADMLDKFPAIGVVQTAEGPVYYAFVDGVEHRNAEIGNVAMYLAF